MSRLRASGRLVPATSSRTPGGTEDRFRSLVQNSRDLIMVANDNGVLTYVNPAVDEILGYEPDDLVGTAMLGLLHPDDAGRGIRMSGTAAAAHSPQAHFEMRMRRRDGTWRWLEVIQTDARSDPSVRGVITNARDVTDRRSAEANLTHLALHDPLTRLPNRRLLLDRIAQALRRSARDHRMLAVLFCDLDRFKTVNDGLGHEAGDLLLVEMGRRLQGVLRPGDTVARTGGDEFVAVCEGLAGVDEATEIARRIREVVEEPVALRSVIAHVSVSIGIVTVDGYHEPRTEPSTILRNADAAMYRAKDRGRARWELFDDSLAEEALARWKHPVRGLLEPDQFLELAEETGLIVPMGAVVLKEACAQARRWQTSYNDDLWVSVNLSARQVGQFEFSATVAAVLADTGLDPSTLHLELTETVLLQTGHSATSDLLATRELGVRLGMDDFGTGYSSLSYLQHLPIDFLKIDTSFIAGLGSESGDAMVAAVVQLGRSLHLDVVAEGIETPAQLDFLREIGCSHGQGYLLGRPLPADAITEILEAGTPLMAGV